MLYQNVYFFLLNNKFVYFQPNETSGTSTVSFDDFDPFGGPLLSPSKAADPDLTATQEEQPADTNDPFGLGPDAGDPFAPSKDDKNKTENTDDPFSTNNLDPLNQDPFAAKTDHDPFANGADPFGTTQVTIETTAINKGESKMSDVTPAEQNALAAQFDDLMGGLDAGGDVTMTTKTTESADGTVTTTTRTMKMSNGDVGDEEVSLNNSTFLSFFLVSRCFFENIVLI